MMWEGLLGSEREKKERKMTVQRKRHRVTLCMLLGVLLVSGVVAPSSPIQGSCGVRAIPSPQPICFPGKLPF